MQRLKAATACVVVACGCGTVAPPAGADAPSGTAATSPHATAAPSPSAAAPLRGEEAWRVVVHGAEPSGVAALPGGGAAAVFTFAEEARVGERTLTSRGEGDLLVVVVDAAGTVTRVTQLGGEGDDTFEGLAVSDDAVHVAVRSDGALAFPGVTLTPRALRAGDVVAPRVCGVARLTLDGAVIGGLALDPDARDLDVAATLDRDVVVGLSFTGEDELFGRGEVQRLRVDGSARWKRTFDAAEVHRVQSVRADEIAVSLRLQGSLRVQLLDAGTGAVRRELRVDKPLGTGDLGTIDGLLRVGRVEHAHGSTGDDVIVSGQRVSRPSYAIQPFVLSKRPDEPPTFVDVADVTGAFLGVGMVRGEPAAHLHVIHTRPGSPLHRGEYLVIGAPPRFLPIYQYRHANDDWEHEPAETVHGTEIHVRAAAFGRDAVFLVGRCTRSERPACLVGVSL